MKTIWHWIVFAFVLMSWTKDAAAISPTLLKTTPAAEDAVHDVFLRLERKDCPGAVRELNAGLAKAYPEIALLAGAMYEEGTCVKRDWDRAVHFYLKAHEGGQRAAAYRLQSGYAAPANGPDMAAALWWTHQFSPKALPGCAVSEQARNDPDRFVAELQTWPRSRLEACNYVIGVMSTLSGDIEYPATARSHAIAGTVHVRFIPSIPRIEIKTGETEELQIYGLVDGNTVRDRQAKFITGSFEEAIHDVANRALKRYPQPAGIDPGWTFESDFIFKLEP